MQTYQEIIEALKRCDVSESNCEKCQYVEEFPNQCIKHLHHDCRHILSECYEMAKYYQRKASE